MKLLFILGFTFLFGWLTSSTKTSPVVKSTKQLLEIKDSIQFTNHIQPIFIKNCSPCHFPGGKMYGKMPFDKDTTIINHQAAILKRIKGDENALLKTYFDQEKR